MACWAMAVLAGIMLLAFYSTSPGAAASDSSGTWPAGSAMERASGRSTLLMFAHPHCPCTRIALAELTETMARSRGNLSTTVMFVRPNGVEAGWEKTSLWQRAQAIPGVRVECDAGGVEAARFGAMTSGHVLLYDPQGELVFSGGITAGRGHGGDNPGRQAVLALSTGRAKGAASRWDVYGCPLASPAESSCSMEGADECGR